VVIILDHFCISWRATMSQSLWALEKKTLLRVPPR
jgi:hypothetical protein